MIFLPITLLAQLSTYPLERNSKQIEKRENRFARIKSLNPLSLPFWDDFSFIAQEEVHPADSLWIKNNKVIVSSGQAVNPPSINVATFDGLDSTGIAYSPNPTDVLAFGYRDTLESQPIKLTEVPLINRDSVFLSFSYQAGGNGEPPDPIDFLRLEFKKSDGNWKTITTLTVEDASDPTIFYDTLIQINQAEYYHDDFRFRFISFGRKSGRYDAWHIDYVYLNEHRHKNDDAFPDRSLSSPLGPIFGKYYAVPIKHFFKQPEINTTSFYVRNLFNDTTVLTYNTFLKSEKKHTGSPLPVSDSDSLDTKTPLFDSTGTVGSRELREVLIATLPLPTDKRFFDPTAQGIELSMTLHLVSGDSIFYDPIDFHWNDTLRVKYFLDSVYAYDDGVAEYSAGLVDPGNELAYRFDNVHAGKDSIINGVNIYFPSFTGVTSANNLEFFILDDNNGNPGNVLYEQTIDISLTSMNQFMVVDSLYEGVIVQDVFYIGYREPSTGRVRIGLDKSNDTGDQMYYRLSENGQWQQNDRVTGSLMMRPRFGPATVNTSIQETLKPVSIYPNPNRGEFYVKGSFDQLRVLSITGQPVNTSIEDLGDTKKISVATASAGVYIVQYKSATRIYTEKILITR